MATDHNFKIKNGLIVEGNNVTDFRGIDLVGSNPAVYFKDSNASTAWHIGQNGANLWVLEDTNRSGGYNNIRASWDATGYEQYDGNINIRVGSLTMGNSDTVVIDSSRNLTNIGTIQNGSVWINDGTAYNNYNENIRLFNPANNVSVIAFSATGTAGVPTSSILGYSDRFETRLGTTWRTRVYSSGLYVNGGYYVGTTGVIDSSRNLTNIGTISSGAIESTGRINIDTADTTLPNTYFSAERHNDSNGKLVFGAGELDPAGGATGETYIGNHNRRVHIGAVFDGTNHVPTAAPMHMMIDIDGDLYVSQNNVHTRWFEASARNLQNIGTINTGQGATEVYLMNQNVRSSDSPTFQDLTIQGNLAITGDINSYNITDLDVVDKTITLGVGGTALANDGGGIIVDGADAKLTWNNTNSYWQMNKQLAFNGTATTTNQQLGIVWSGFDKESAADFSDNASIIHTINTGGHTGSVLLFTAQNDANDGIAFVTNGSSSLKHNSSNILTAANFTSNVTPVDNTKLPKAGGTMTGAINMGSNNISAINNATAVSFLSTNGYWSGGTQRMNGSGNLLNIGTISTSNTITTSVGSTLYGLDIIGSSSSYTAAAIKNTGTGDAILWFDASNGDLSGSDYASVRQNNNLEIVLRTETNGGGISFQTKGNQRFRISGGGTLERGSSNTATLTQAGHLTVASGVVSGNLDVANNIRHEGDTDTYIQFTDGEIDFFANGVNGFMTSSGGFVVNPNSGNYDFIVRGDTDNQLIYGDASTDRVGIGITSPNVKLAVDGQLSTGDRRLSLGILDLNSGSTPTQFKIITNIPFVSGSADFTVNIKGFRYGTNDMVDLSIGWHYYNSTFYNPSVKSSGGYAPTITLGVENSKVVIHLASPGYWPKLYVESMYSSAYRDSYARGWSWSDSAISSDSGTPTVTPAYSANFGNNFQMKDNGNVGVGVTPGAKFHVNSSSTIGWSNLANAFILSGTTSAGIGIDDNEIMAKGAGNLYFGTGGSNEDVIIRAGGTTAAMTIRGSDQNVGIRAGTPFSRLQSGSHTFSGANGMHANSRVGISNHGTLTGMMLASTYNDSTFPEYGLVFVQGPSTSSYNVWSISPDGPAKGDGLNFIYGSGVTNIHTSTPKVTFDGNGNVGIGTDSPARKLDVKGAVQFSVNTASHETFVFSTQASNEAKQIMKNASSHDTIILNTGGASYFNGGNVGIGTDSPAAKLDVEGGALGGTTGNTATAAIIRAGRQNLVFQDTRTATGTDWNNATFKMIAQIDSTNHQSIDFVNDSSYNEHIDIKTGNQVFNTRFTHDGKVGIGTTSPGNKLTVARPQTTTFSDAHLGLKATATTNITGRTAISMATSTVNNYGVTLNGIRHGSGSGEPRFGIKMHNNSSAGLEALSIRASGNVGIGTTSPNTELQVGDPETGNTGLTIASIYSSAAASLKFRTGHPNNTNVWDTAQIQATDDGNYNGRMTFNVSVSGQAAPTTRMFIRANGNVGIGNGLFTPNSLLDVNGRVTANNLTLQNLSGQSSEATAVMIDGSGIIGTRELGSNAFNSTTIPSLSGYATESYVGTQINNLIDGAPGTLNTLNELAAAVADNNTFFSTVLPKSGGEITGGLTISGSVDPAGTDMGFYQSAGTNLILKGDASGRSGIFFQSEKNGTNINHPSDYGFIQFHAYGYGGTSGESIDMVIGTANDSTDHVILQSPYKGGVKVGYKDATSGTGLTLQTVFHDAYHPNADTLTTARTISLGGDVTGSASFNGSSNITITAAVANDSHTHDGRYFTESESDARFTSKDHFRHTGTGNYTSTTTSALLTEVLGDDGFDSYLTAHKTSWSYAGNGNLTDAGRLTELAGSSWLWWTDNSGDNVRGNITGLAIAPTTGGSAGKMFVYNNQGESYSPGWREIWTSTSDGAGSGLDADKLDAQEGSYYLNYNNLTNKPTIPTNNNQLTNGAGYTTYTANQSLNTTNSPTFANLNTTNTGYVGIGDDVRFKDVSVANTAGVVGQQNNDRGFISFGSSTTGLGRIGTGQLTWGGDDIYHEGHKPTLAELGYTGASNANYITNNNQLTNGASYITASSSAITNKLPLAGGTITGSLTVNGTYIADTSQQKVKYSVWSGSTYGIGMHNAITYGGLNDYGMTFQMNSEDDRGFWWGDSSHTLAQGAMALTTNGYLTVANGVRIGYGESDTTTPSAGLEVAGDIYGRSVNNAYSSLYRFGGIYFTWDSDSYGTNTHHSIRSTYGDTYGDHITLNSFGNVRINIDSNSNGTNVFEIGNGTTGTGNNLLQITEAAKMTLGRDGLTPVIKLDYDNNHASGAQWNTSLEFGRSNEFQSQTGSYPLYEPANAGHYGMKFQGNSDAVFFGAEQYTTGHYRPVIAWGDDTSDSPFFIRYNWGTKFAFTYNGIFHADSDVIAYSTTTSDAKFKDNVTTIDNALDKVQRLRGVEFDWNATSRKGLHDIGFIAQEIEKVIPEVVTEQELVLGDFEDTKEKAKTVAYGQVTALLVEAVKEQQETINKLINRINDLEKGE